MLYEKKFPVREALYENPAFFDEFVAENPQQFSPTELEIVSQWKQYLQTDFYIERFLKPYAIFIDPDQQVYGVLGLYEGFNELIDREILPLRVRTVLLPFQGKVVYDGLMQPYNIYFGRGIKDGLKETYLTAKQNKEIITSFALNREQHPPAVLKNWQPLLEQLQTQANQLKGGNGQPALYNPAFALVKTSLEFAQLAVSPSPDEAQLLKCLKKINRLLNQADVTLMRNKS